MMPVLIFTYSKLKLDYSCVQYSPLVFDSESFGLNWGNK